MNKMVNGVVIAMTDAEIAVHLMQANLQMPKYLHDKWQINKST